MEIIRNNNGVTAIEGNSRFSLDYRDINPQTVANIISVLGNANLSQLFSQRDITRMQLYLKIAIRREMDNSFQVTKVNELENFVDDEPIKTR